MFPVSDHLVHTLETEGGKMRASLISFSGDFMLAEDALQDACLLALEVWPVQGIPNAPGAWLLTTARRKIIDRLRRAQTLQQKIPLLEHAARIQQTLDLYHTDHDLSYPDERLKLLFTCCHPALSWEMRIALTLHTIGGLTTAEIAHAFLIPLPTMAQRLTRAKRKIRDAGIPYRVPPPELLQERLADVHTVLYLIFTAGYTATNSTHLMREDLCQEAIRLARVLVTLSEQENKADAESYGLIALLLLHDARRLARTTIDGKVVRLDEQDRTAWNQEQIAEGIAWLDRALTLHRPGPYQIQAAIAALHDQAEKSEDTDWAEIAALYTSLHHWQPTPIVALNRAVAIGMATSSEQGLALLDEPELSDALDGYHLYHAARADFLKRLARWPEAACAYQDALRLCDNDAERQYLQEQVEQVTRRHLEP